MTYEVELKARLTNPEVIEKRTKTIGTFVKETNKKDIYFRPKGDISKTPKDRYRIRFEAGTATVTFKQKMLTENIEVNKEIEFTVDDATAFYQFADRFGFEPFVVKQKRSRVYLVNGVSVELNKVEHLGYFAELELLCEAEADIDKARQTVGLVFARLGLTETDLEPQRYIDMIQQAYPAIYRLENGILQTISIN